jgi:hypothetical protein
MGSQQGDAFFFSYTPELHFLNDKGEVNGDAQCQLDGVVEGNLY